MAPLIQLEKVTKIYRMGSEELRALNDVSLSIEHGEFVAIMGASGSGKSTLMNLIGCLDRPTSGRYLLAGQDVSGLTRNELARIRSALGVGRIVAGDESIAAVTFPLLEYRTDINQEDVVRA